MRITRKVFHDLAVWMIVFGLAIGAAFPFFVVLLGVPAQSALTVSFFLACLGAGTLVGIFNYSLARLVVGARMRLLARSMEHVEAHLISVTSTGDMAQCTPAECTIDVDSEDEIGESAMAFNRLVRALADSMQTQAAVRAFATMLTSHLDIETLTRKALDQLIEHTDADGGAILCESGGDLQIAAVHGLREAESLARSDHVRRAVRTGEPQALQLPDGIVVDGVVADFVPAEVFVLPVMYKSIPLGVITLAASKLFSIEARTRMDLFRQSFGLALNNAIAHDRLQKLAALDPLTGVYNRRFGLTRLHEEFDRAVRINAPVGVLMFDIDHFKHVNDTYGHLVGDRLLLSVTQTAKMILREGDVLVRYGGEEFLAILPAASSEDVGLVGERLRRAVEDTTVADGAQTISVTISLGTASYPNPAVEREDQLVQLADAALYRAKESGRNRLVRAR